MGDQLRGAARHHAQHSDDGGHAGRELRHPGALPVLLPRPDPAAQRRSRAGCRLSRPPRAGAREYEIPDHPVCRGWRAEADRRRAGARRPRPTALDGRRLLACLQGYRRFALQRLRQRPGRPAVPAHPHPIPQRKNQMTATRVLTGTLLVAVPIVLTAGFTGLQMTFDYPAILRHPAGEVLTRFADGSADLHAYWYAMFIAAVALIPAAIGFALLNWRQNQLGAALAGGFGVLAGLLQALGLLRWTVLVPSLATAYTAPGASDLDKALATSAFDTANAYLGMGVGEHMGYLLSALFSVAVAMTIVRRWPLMAWTGIVLALGVASGMHETFGDGGVSMVNAIAYMAWSLWAVILGVLLLRGSRAE